MRKTKWLNLQGSVLAATTLAAVAAGARHVQRKYAGKKSSLLTFDKEYLTNYAFERFVLDNDKVTNFINSHLGQAENKVHKNFRSDDDEKLQGRLFRTDDPV